MILSIGGIKGGSGKTTLAINIAVAKSLKKRKVLLVDADEQKSSTMWSQKREELKLDNRITTIQLTGSSVLSEVKKIFKNFDDIIIDVGGRNNSSLRASLLVSDVFLTPFRPRSLDIWTLDELTEILREAVAINPKLSVCAVLNQADFRGRDNAEAMGIFKDYPIINPLKAVISQRKIFPNAINEGLGILEYTPSDEKAEKELKSLISKIYRKDIAKHADK